MSSNLPAQPGTCKHREYEPKAALSSITEIIIIFRSFRDPDQAEPQGQEGMSSRQQELLWGHQHCTVLSFGSRRQREHMAGTIPSSTRRDAEKEGLCQLQLSSPKRDWSGPAAQQDVWEKRKERSGKREDCAGSMQQAEIPGRSKHTEKGGFV